MRIAGGRGEQSGKGLFKSVQVKKPFLLLPPENLLHVTSPIMILKRLLYCLAIAAITAFLPMAVFAGSECSPIHWDASDHPNYPNPDEYNWSGIFTYSNHTTMRYYVYPYGKDMGVRTLYVTIRSNDTPETAQRHLKHRQKSLVELLTYTSLGHVPDLEETVIEEVQLYRRVWDSGCQGCSYLGIYRETTVIHVYSVCLDGGSEGPPPLIIPSEYYHAAYREAKRLIDRKCPTYRIEPFEAALPVGAAQTFSVFDSNDQQVNNANITWAVVGHSSISQFIANENAKIGSIDAQGSFTATGIGTCLVRATLEDGAFVDAPVSVRCADGAGNLAGIQKLFQQRLPEGPFHQDLKNGRLSRPFTTMNPGYATNIYASRDARYANYTCGAYQDKVLQFLHAIQSDPQECGLLNGFEFGPIQGSYGGHHAVTIYPAGGDWKTQGMIFDPWYHQKPEFFSVDVWAQVFAPISGDTSPGYRLKYPTTHDASDYDTDIWLAAEGFVTSALQVCGIIDCPVKVLFTDDQGRRSGLSAEGTFLFEIPDTFFMRLPDGSGGYDWYFRLSSAIDSYRMEITGESDGDFELLTASANTQAAYYYAAHPLKSGQTSTVNLSSNNPAPPLTLPDTSTVLPLKFDLPEGCWLIDTDLDILIPRAMYEEYCFSFTLRYSHDLFWRLDADTFAVTGSGEGLLIGEDLSLSIPCAEYQDMRMAFKLIYDHDLYWRLDLESLVLQ